METNISMYAFMRAYRAKQGEEIAVVRGMHKMTFNRLEKEINRVAAGLYALGVRKGDIVMSALPNIEQGIVLLYAVSKLGSVFSPVHPLISKAEFIKEVKLQRPKVVVLSDVNMFGFCGCLSGAKLLYCPYWMYAYVGLPHKKHFEEYTGNGDISAIYMHSGGTSGVPKTVDFPATAANNLVLNLLSYITYKFDEKDGMLITLPMFHGFGLIAGVHNALATNMAAVLVPKFNGKKAVNVIRRNKVTSMIAVPRMLKKLLETDTFNGANISTLHNVYVGGDALDGTLSANFDKRLKEAGSAAVVQQGYGLTEVGSVCVLSEKNAIKGSIGRAIDNVDVLIIGENGKTVNVGETGELLVGGEQLMRGYLGDSAATSAAFISIDGKNYLKTGDLFRADDNGNLFYVGRKKRLIKISGMNVFPAEIERVVGECGFDACVALEMKRNGKTYIRLVVEGNLDEKKKDEILKTIADKLSHWHLPEEIVCVKELPRTAIGKIDYLRLQNEHK